MQVRLLGPVEVVTDGTPRTLTGVKQTAVLGALALAGERGLTRDQLVDVVWPDDPPETAVNTLQVHLSQLRKALSGGHARILFTDGRYRLVGDSISVDAADFDRLCGLAHQAVVASRFPEAASVLDEALGLWRGPPLAEVASLPYFRPEVARLGAVWLGAREDESRTLLGLGRSREAASHLEVLVEHYPFHEELRGLLMLALYRCGRQTDALEAFRRGREVLVTDRGLEPGPALRQLHRAILNHDPALASPRAQRDGRRVPAPLTPMIGRSESLRDVCGLLTRDSGRLVVITGLGGVGKTTLAAEAARALRPSYPGGIVWVDLTSTPRAELLLAVIAEALEVTPAPNESLLEAIGVRLEGHAALLVLDNFEHLLPAARTLHSLLARVGDLRVLVTSRSPLGISGEQAYELGPLETPPAETLLTVGDLDDYAASRLFIERARGVAGAVVLEDGDAADVATICRQLEGLPLALELAARSVRIMNVRELAAGLDAALDDVLPATGSFPDRHRSLRATMDWTHDLLPPDAATLLRRLSVFRADWTRGAADSVCELEPGRLGAALGVLFDFGLVMRAETPADVRFRLPAIVRGYAAERLETVGEAGRYARRHADHYLMVGEAARLYQRGQDYERRIRGAQQDIPDLIASLEYFADTRRSRELIDLTFSLVPLWVWRVEWELVRTWLTLAVERVPDTGGVRLARALRYLADESMWRDDYDHAEQYAVRAIEALGGHSDSETFAKAVAIQAWVSVMRGQTSRATELVRDAETVAGNLESLPAQASIFRNLALCAVELGDLERAQRFAGRALSQATTAHDGELALSATGCLAFIALLRGDRETAARFAEDCRTTAITLGSRQSELEAESDLGLIALLRMDVPLALRHLKAALAGLHALGDRWITMQCLRGIAACASAIGDPDAAYRIAGAEQAARTASVSVAPADIELLAAANLLVREPSSRQRQHGAWRAGQQLTLNRAVECALQVEPQRHAATGRRPAKSKASTTT